jgi:hypothetical protein
LKAMEPGNKASARARFGHRTTDQTQAAASIDRLMERDLDSLPRERTEGRRDISC